MWTSWTAAGVPGRRASRFPYSSSSSSASRASRDGPSTSASRGTSSASSPRAARRAILASRRSSRRVDAQRLESRVLPVGAAPVDGIRDGIDRVDTSSVFDASRSSLVPSSPPVPISYVVSKRLFLDARRIPRELGADPRRDGGGGVGPAVDRRRARWRWWSATSRIHRREARPRRDRRVRRARAELFAPGAVFGPPECCRTRGASATATGTPPSRRPTATWRSGGGASIIRRSVLVRPLEREASSSTCSVPAERWQIVLRQTKFRRRRAVRRRLRRVDSRRRDGDAIVVASWSPLASSVRRDGREGKNREGWRGRHPRHRGTRRRRHRRRKNWRRTTTRRSPSRRRRRRIHPGDAKHSPNDAAHVDDHSRLRDRRILGGSIRELLRLQRGRRASRGWRTTWSHGGRARRRRTRRNERRGRNLASSPRRVRGQQIDGRWGRAYANEDLVVRAECGAGAAAPSSAASRNRGRVQSRPLAGAPNERRLVTGAEAPAEANASAGAGADANASAGAGAEANASAAFEIAPGDPFGDSVGAFVGILRRVLLFPTLQGGAVVPYRAGEPTCRLRLRSRRWPQREGNRGRGASRELVRRSPFDLANHAGLFLGGESVIEVAGGFRGGGPKRSTAASSASPASSSSRDSEYTCASTSSSRGRSSSSSTWEEPARGSARERYGPSPRADRDPCSP